MDSTVTIGQSAAESGVPVGVRIDYVNYRGERSLRNIVPQRCYLGEVEWHPGPQWIIDAWDVDKAAVRSFAVCDIQRWDV
jgi:predicted DNA-binding transcriptional regulator YafY